MSDSNAVGPFYDENDPGFSYLGGKGGKAPNPNWDLCTPGKSFFIPCSLEDVKQNRKRPGIPVRHQGKFRTQGASYGGQWGYKVTRKAI